MARYHCPVLDCSLALKLSEQPLCPVHHHVLQPVAKPGVATWPDETGCLAQPENADRLAAAQEQFFSKVFRLENFVPSSARGLFDVKFSPGTKELEITVRVYCEFSMGEVPKSIPEVLQEGYKNLKPWAEIEKGAWLAEVLSSVGHAWDHKVFLRLNKPGWQKLRVSPVFDIKFVNEKGKAHVAAEVKKIPPVDPNFFNCGGTFVGLDQIIQTIQCKSARRRSPRSPVKSLICRLPIWAFRATLWWSTTTS